MELGAEAHLVDVAVAEEEEDAVGVAALEVDELAGEARVARALVEAVAAVDKVRVGAAQLEAPRGRVPPQHAAARDLRLPERQVALRVGDKAHAAAPARRRGGGGTGGTGGGAERGAEGRGPQA